MRYSISNEPSVLQHALDRSRTRGAVVGMDAPVQGCEIDALTRLRSRKACVLPRSSRFHPRTCPFPTSANSALFAARLMRSSLRRKASFERLSSAIATDSNISGVAAISRNI